KMNENVNRNTLRKCKSKENKTSENHKARLTKQHERYYQKKVTETTEQRDKIELNLEAKTAAAKAAARSSHKTTIVATRPHEIAAGLSYKTITAAGSYENAAERSPAELT
ncbi:3625_t:CDS:2, partial [Funneliformis mosseae]